MAHYAHEAVRPRPPRALPERIGYQLPVADASQLATMADYLVGRGLSYQLARENCWYPSTSAGDALPRVVVPAHGNLTTGFWQARAMAPVEPRWQSPHGPRVPWRRLRWAATPSPCWGPRHLTSPWHM